MSGETNSLLDEISAEVAQLSDEEIAKAAQAIQARKEREKARMTPDAKQKMKDREKRRRLVAKEVLRIAKEKGLVAQANANVDSQGGEAAAQ